MEPLSEILLASALATEKVTDASVPRAAADTTYAWLRQPRVIADAVVLLLLIFGGINWLNEPSERKGAKMPSPLGRVAIMQQAQKQTEEIERRQMLAKRLRRVESA